MSKERFHGKILVAEGNSASRFALAIELAGWGAEVLPAVNGADAFGLFEDFYGQLEAVIASHEMSVMGGAELARSIRRTGYQGPIIIMHHDIRNGIRQQYATEGIFSFMKKPIGIDLLVSALAEGCRRPPLKWMLRH